LKPAFIVVAHVIFINNYLTNYLTVLNNPVYQSLRFRRILANRYYWNKRRHPQGRQS